MKKILFWLIIIAVSWLCITNIVIPLTAGIVGYFDKEQDELN